MRCPILLPSGGTWLLSAVRYASRAILGQARDFAARELSRGFSPEPFAVEVGEVWVWRMAMCRQCQDARGTQEAGPRNYAPRVFSMPSATLAMPETSCRVFSRSNLRSFLASLRVALTARLFSFRSGVRFAITKEYQHFAVLADFVRPVRGDRLSVSRVSAPELA